MDMDIDELLALRAAYQREDGTIPDWLHTPIFLDLTGNGIQTTSVDDGVLFDLDADGHLEETAWAAPGTGILVRDINGNGRIDSGAELFGDSTVLKSGKKAINGFVALADLDFNNDGRIDELESRVFGLRIWRDDNMNGIADEGELLTFREADVHSINLSFKVSLDRDANGNSHRMQGTYVRTDGTIRAAVDVWLLGVR